MAPERIAERAVELAPWFYDYALPGGVRTAPELPERLRTMHASRLAMLRAALDALGEVPTGSALDAGCHEGNFSLALRDAGFATVVGVDVREESVAKARFVAQAMGVGGASFHAMDAEELDRELAPGRFDVALVFGLIYHLESPMRVMRQIAARTDHAMIIETQLCPEPGERGYPGFGEEAGREAPPGLHVEWGRREHKMRARGGFAIIDESPMHATNTETGATSLALCPSAHAVESMCAAVGFPAVTRIDPPADGNEQLLRGRRGVFLAKRS